MAQNTLYCFGASVAVLLDYYSSDVREKHKVRCVFHVWRGCGWQVWFIWVQLKCPKHSLPYMLKRGFRNWPTETTKYNWLKALISNGNQKDKILRENIPQNMHDLYEANFQTLKTWINEKSCPVLG